MQEHIALPDRHSSSTLIALRCIFLFLCFSLYSFWALNLPTTMAPDEPMRLMVPNFIVNNGCLPLGDDPSIINYTWGSSYGFSTYGSSLFAIPFMMVAKIVDGSTMSVLLAARFANIALSISTLVCCFLISDSLKLPHSFSFLYVGLVAFLPQYVFLSSYFNSDILEFFSTALVLYALIRGHQSVWSKKSCIFLGISLGILALSNYYAYGAIIASVVFYFGSSCFHLKKNKTLSKKSMLICRPFIVLFSALAIAGWFFVRNAVLYDGDIFGLSTSAKTAERLAAPDFKPSQKTTPMSLGMSPIDMLAHGFAGIDWIRSTINSAIGVFGPMQFPLGNTIYHIYYILFCIGFVSGAYYCIKNGEKGMRLVLLFTSLLILVIPILLSIYYSWSSDYQAQGRYIMAGIALYMFIIALGLHSLALKVERVTCRLCAQCDSILHFDCTVSINARNTIYTFIICILLLFYILLFAKSFIDVAIPNCWGPPANETLVAVLSQ